VLRPLLAELAPGNGQSSRYASSANSPRPKSPSRSASPRYTSRACSARRWYSYGSARPAPIDDSATCLDPAWSAP
jgi:hypothetical protein